MRTTYTRHLRHPLAVIVVCVCILWQRSEAQSYMNLNFTNSTNKYSLIADVKSITFDGSGGVVVRKTDNSSATETLTLLKSITLDETSGGGSPLPVDLVSFTVTARGMAATLRWATATEMNTAGFEIERTAAGGQLSAVRWRREGFVEGSGTTNAPREYTFSDTPPGAGAYSYRLKQIDRDGRFEYSNTVDVIIGGTPSEFGLEQNYPNPFNPATQITYQLSADGMTTLVVYDAIGRV
ncbi:MAG: hypothetical protein HUU02_06655, partial [Bacteroidetes bacterium]|nr:hypothetical protein [Bacteroidota bacterium]